MPGQVAQTFDALRHSLWFVPTVSVGLATGLAAATVWASTLTPTGTEPGAPTLLFGGGPDEARAMLQTIAGSVITVAGVTFSITVVALQLASSQYSPRVLGSFLRDLGNQVALGIFIGTFVFALLILQTIRDEAGDQPAFVPSVAMTAALGLALLSVGTIVYFIHHISTQIQISSIVEEIADETVGLIRRSWPDAGGDAQRRGEAASDDGRDADWDVAARAPRSGFVQYVAVEGLIDVAAEADALLRVEPGPGSWIDEGAPIVRVRGGDIRHTDALERHVRIGSERTMQQDASFGVRQLVDIAVKALSPGINDPTSATYCVERLATILIEAGTRADPPTQHHASDGRLAVMMPVPGFSDLTSLAYDQIRHYGGDDAYVMRAVAEALVRIARRTPLERHAALREQAEALLATTDRMEPARGRELRAIVAELT